MKKSILFISIFFALSLQLFCQQMLEFRRTNGPYLQIIKDIKFNRKNDIFILSSNNGTSPYSIFRSTDTGNTWKDLKEKVPFGIYSFDISIAEDISSDSSGNQIDVLYVLSVGCDSLAKSFDGGENWIWFKTNIKFEQSSFFGIISPNDMIVSCSNNHMYGNPNYYVYRSFDKGLSWQKGTPLQNNYYYLTILTKINDSIYLASAYGSYWYISKDNGNSWHILPREYSSNANFFFQGCLYNLNYLGLHKSCDYSETWEHNIPSGLYSFQSTSCILTANNILYNFTTYYIYQSNDLGLTWHDVYRDDLGIKKSAMDFNNRLYYLNEYNMLFFSVDPEPKELDVKGIYPNPANGELKVAYKVVNAGYVKCSIYDLLGREVTVLFDEFKELGEHSETFNIEFLPSGIYYLKFEQDWNVIINKLVVVR